jgi:thiamine-phosphate pyrophosphorylase
MLDANMNRAREALRTLEDIARFALSDDALVRRCKAARHDLVSAVEQAGVDPLALLASRDTPGDVGTGVLGPREAARASLADVAASAAGRLSEALRVVEECLKTFPGDAWSRVESTRYAAYDLDRAIRLALGAGDCPQWRLCVLITAELCPDADWKAVAAAALDAGADCLQLREKGLPDAVLLDRARELVAIARGRAAVIINDRVDIALAAGADGVHLGQDDLPVSAARALAGERLWIGVSTHDEAEARRALADGADYCGVGAMFPSGTKVRAVSGPDYLRCFLALAAESRPLPHLAIGGITPGTLPALVSVGCRGVAVSSVVCGSADPAATCRTLLDILGRAGR